MNQIRIQVYGLVQGVNLRNRVKRYADILGVKGFVENKSDGSVVIIAQGDESQLEELLSWIERPPFPAKNKGMSYEWQIPSETYTSFAIKRGLSAVTDQIRSFLNLGKEVIHLQTPTKVPKHVVIIPDGNRRWARNQGWHPWVGHRKSMAFNRFNAFIEECRDLHIGYLSFWGFSTENWDRDQEELDILWDIYRKNVENWRKVFQKEEVRFRHMGRKDRLPADIVADMTLLEEETKHHTKLNFQFCLDYGGRDDLVRAINKMLEAGIDKVDESMVSKFLDTADIPDPDLIIRTSGEKRTSGIMAYQATYAELYFTNVPFPEFDAEMFRRAILEYAGRTRRFGGTAAEDLEKLDLSRLQDLEIDPETGEFIAK